MPGAGGNAGTRPAAPGYAGAPVRAPGYAAGPAQRSSKPLVTQGDARYSPGVAVNGSATRGAKPLVSGGTSRGVAPSTKPLVSGGSVNSMPGAGPMRGARPPSSGGWNNGNGNWHGNNHWNGNRWHGNSGWWGPGWRGGWWGGWWGPAWGWGAGWWGPGWGWWGPTWTSWWWGPAWGLGWWGPAWNAGWWGVGVPGFSIVIPISGGTSTTIIEQPQPFTGEFAAPQAVEPEEPTEYRLYCPPSDAFQPHVQTCTQPWVKVPVPKNSQDGSRTPPPDAPAGSLPPGASPAPRSNGYAPQGGATTVPYAPSRQSPPRPQYETTAAIDDGVRAVPVSSMLANGYGEVLALGDAGDKSGATATGTVSTSSGGRIAAPRMTAPGTSPPLLARGG